MWLKKMNLSVVNMDVSDRQTHKPTDRQPHRKNKQQQLLLPRERMVFNIDSKYCRCQ